MSLASAMASPRSVETTNSAWTTINHSAGREVRRCRKPDRSDLAPMPTRITDSSSENTARNPPSRIETCLNQRISSPIAAKPDRASARLTRGTDAFKAGRLEGWSAGRLPFCPSVFLPCWSRGDKESPHPRDDVEHHGDHLSAAKTSGRHQHEVRQKTPQRRAGRVHRIEHGDSPAGVVEVASDKM